MRHAAPQTRCVAFADGAGAKRVRHSVHRRLIRGASIERRGNLDALILSELAYDDDLFERKVIDDELYYYGHEKQREEERQRRLAENTRRRGPLPTPINFPYTAPSHTSTASPAAPPAANV